MPKRPTPSDTQKTKTELRKALDAALPKKQTKGSQHLDEARVQYKAMQAKAISEQQRAVEAVSDALLRSHYASGSDRPRAVFLFAGPTSAGKTHFATQILPNALNQGIKNPEEQWKLKVFNMGNYQSDNSSFFLNGLPKGYSSATYGVMTEFVYRNPKSIVVFDEFDAAHHNVQNVLNEVLDHGSCTDLFGIPIDPNTTPDDQTPENSVFEVDFSQTILVFITSSGEALYGRHDYKELLSSNPTEAEGMVFDTLRRTKKLESDPKGNEVPQMSPELFSRLLSAHLALFEKPGFDSVFGLIKDRLLQECDLFEQHFATELNFENIDTLTKLLILSNGPRFELRRITEKIPLLVLDPITDSLRDNKLKPGPVAIRAEGGEEILQLLEKTRETIFRDFMRKSQSVIYTHETSNSDRRITFKGFEIQKIKRVTDFGGKGGIAVELPDVGFDQISGHDMVKKRLVEVVALLKNQNSELAAYMPRGVLLFGPPGTGKTMLAKALASEADLPFIPTSGPELMSLETITEVFKRAREYAPAIVFIDEMDTFQKRTGARSDALINQLLAEIDGFSNRPDEQIFVVGATNLPGKIDLALLRSGRIDLHVQIDHLDRGARAYFIGNMLKNPRFDPAIDQARIVHLTAGYSGADLKKLERESILSCVRKGQALVREADLVEQIDHERFGEKHERPRDAEERLRHTAWHEAGHAVVSVVLQPDVVIEQVTIGARGNAEGFVAFSTGDNENRRERTTKAVLQNQTCIALAGRLSEIRKFGPEEGICAGAVSDLDRAAKIAYFAVAELGMGEASPHLSTLALQTERTAFLLHETEQEVKKWIATQTARCEKLLQEHWAHVETIAKVLLERETIDGNELKKLIKHTPVKHRQ